MASGTLTTAYKGWTYRIYWTSTPSVENNASTVVCDHWLVMDTAYSISIGSRSNTCTVGTDAKSFTSPAINASGTTVALGTTTHTVPHNADGSMSAALSSTFNVNATLAGVKQNAWTITATLTLDTIPRTSKVTLSSSSFEMGSRITINTNRAASSFKHSLYYTWMGSGWIRIADNVETSHGWTPKVEDLAPSIPKADKGQGVIYCETYLNGNYIGTSSASFEATLPASVKPEIAVLMVEPTGLGDKYGALVQGRSTIRIQTDGTEAYGSAISRYDVIVDGLTYKGRDITTKEISGTDGVAAVKVTATDERGRTSEPFEASLTVLEYKPPAVTALSVYRCDEDGTENDQGEFIQATFSASVTPLNGKNSATYTLRCGALSSDMELYDLSRTYSVTSYAVTPFRADGSSSWTIEVEAADDLTDGNRTTSVSTAFTIMNWGPEGRGMAFGKVAEKPGTMEIALDVEFLGAVKGAIFDAIYPVNSIYISYSHTDPATLFGGTWERITGAFLYGVENNWTIGYRAGEATHTLTQDEIPPHSHTFASPAWYTGDDINKYDIIGADTTTTARFTRYTDRTGGGAAHNNMPPYIQVSIWRRTA